MVNGTLDYVEIGLRAGLEVHQQLLTEHKMFCRCPAGLYTDEHDGTVLRHMRPTLSELGEYDGTALMEFKTRKNIVYLLNRKNVCTYEMDDTPPFLVNQQALDIAIEQCLMLGCDIVDEVHIARKQYLDGSIPTGFQRTAIVGVNGRLPFRGRSLTVVQVSVEEDSCREVSDEGHLIVWRTDRLGMPLIETVTAPELRTPDEVAEAILLIGRVCRSTGHVRTGLGASRQDVNVSVRGGRRVEMKGVPQAGWAPRLVHGEAVRQVNLLKLRERVRRLGFRRPDDIRMHHEDVTAFFRNSAFPQLRVSQWAKLVKETGRRPQMELGRGPFTVRAVRLEGLSRILAHPTQPDHTFAHELAGRIRVIAGLDQQPILMHDDHWPDYTSGMGELRRLKEKMRCGEKDSLILVWGPAEDTLTAADEIRNRFVEALDGVPAETRQPFPDGRTDFERILPGPDRMYPDTDSPPSRVTPDRVERLRAGLPPAPWDREKRYEAARVPRLTIHYLIRRGGADLVDRVAPPPPAGREETEDERALVRRACFFFGERLKGWRRLGLAVEKIPHDRWDELFVLLQKRPLLRDVLRDVLRRMAAAPGWPVTALVDDMGLDVPAPEWREQVAKDVREQRGEYSRRTREARRRWHLGQALQSLRGRVAVHEVAAAIEEALAATPSTASAAAPDNLLDER